MKERPDRSEDGVSRRDGSVQRRQPVERSMDYGMTRSARKAAKNSLNISSVSMHS